MRNMVKPVRHSCSSKSPQLTSRLVLIGRMYLAFGIGGGILHVDAEHGSVPAGQSSTNRAVPVTIRHVRVAVPLKLIF